MKTTQATALILALAVSLLFVAGVLAGQQRVPVDAPAAAGEAAVAGDSSKAAAPIGSAGPVVKVAAVEPPPAAAVEEPAAAEPPAPVAAAEPKTRRNRGAPQIAVTATAAGSTAPATPAPASATPARPSRLATPPTAPAPDASSGRAGAADLAEIPATVVLPTERVPHALTELSASVPATHEALRSDPAAASEDLLASSAERWKGVESYKSRLTKQERRQGILQEREIIATRFHKPYCIFLEWLDENNHDKKSLYVHGKYENQLSIQVATFLLRIRASKPVDHPDVMAKTLSPITDGSLGRWIAKIRERGERAAAADSLQVTYHGLARLGSPGPIAYHLERRFPASTVPQGYTRDVVWIDTATLMPLRVELHDGDGLVARYQHDRLVLDPKLANGTDELTAKEFYRSLIFADDRDWGPPRETWQFSDLPLEPR